MLITRSWQTIKRKHLKYFLLLSFTQPFCYFLGESFGLTTGFINYGIGYYCNYSFIQPDCSLFYGSGKSYRSYYGWDYCFICRNFADAF